MLGVQILTHAIRMILSNAGAALRISALPMLVVLALTLAMGGPSAMLVEPDAPQPAGQAGGLLLATLLQLAATLWIAVAWHRYVLLGEAPEGYVPPFNGAAVLSYLWAGIIFSLVLIVVAIPFVLLTAVIVGPMIVADQGLVRGPVALVLFVLVWLPVTFVSYRISPILPSAAIGNRLPLKEAWYATGTGGASFIVLALASVLLVWALNVPSGLLVHVSALLAFLWAFAVQWAVTLGAASVLTTIYGHFVEKRELHG
jgi:hypothetical protein